MTIAAAELQSRIIEMVADTLELEIEEIQPHSRFFADLGGESIDLLDLQFKIEQELERCIDLNNAFAKRVETNEAGEVTQSSLDDIQHAYPFLAVDALPCPVTPDGLRDLLTITAITEFVAAAEPKQAA